MTETPPLEDRLRAHFADRAAREPLEEPDLDAVMAGRRLVALPPAAGRRRPPFRWMAVGGVAAACAIAAATLVALDADRGRVHVAPPAADRPTTTTERRPSPAPGPTTSTPRPSGPGATTAPDPAAPPPTTPGTAVSVSRGEVLGWWDGQGWVQPDPDRTAPVAGGEHYQIVHLGDSVTDATGSGLRSGCDPSGRPSAVDVGLPQPDPDRDSGPVAVTGVPEPRPRPVTVIDPSGATYRAASAEVLAGLGIDDPQPAVRQVVRGDLGGDGTNEVIVVVERLGDPNGFVAGSGDYSVVFMRRMVGGELRTFVIAQSIPDLKAGGVRFVQVHDVDALVDLNGDGRMEVVVGYRYDESGGTVVYEVAPDGGLVPVLNRGCGV